MTTLFKEPPSSDPIDWATIPEYSKWSESWLDIKDREVKDAIYQSSIKKAPGPDKVSFLIIQKAYQNLESRFNRLYRTLIRKGYHPRCWKIAKGVVLKKSGQHRDYTMPKAYRIVSLLNCLGKISEKILAKRLADLAESPDSDLLYHDQMGSRPKKSAIDSVLSLVHDIQMAKHRKKKSSTMFMDVKGAFDHVSVYQLLRICNRLGLPRPLIKWIYSFMSNRKVLLAFDGEESKIMPINIGIPQGSPISPILFAIYVRFLYDFSEAGDKRSMLELARYLSYVDDNSITISSDSHEKNCRILEKISHYLIEKGKEDHILFDHDKTELIHFFPNQSIDLDDARFKVKIGEKVVKAQESLKWLGIYLDSRLNFKEHVTQKVAEATRVFHQIERLSNTERGLSFQAMRQLYIACICSIADYGVPIWWSNQQYLLDKYQKLQNQALLKILGAFKHSPIRAMEIEASLPPPAARFNKICRSYALRTADFVKSHAIRSRLPENFFLNQGNMEIDRSKFLDWNTPISQGPQALGRKRAREDRDDPDYRPRNTRKHPTQLIRLLSLVAPQPSWRPQDLAQVNLEPNPCNNLVDLIDITISDQSKESQARTHRETINQWVKERSQIDDKIIVYSDGSQSERGCNGSGIFIANSDFSKQDSKAWNLGKECEVYDAEIFAIYKALEIGNDRVDIETLDIWVFSDSQAVLKGLAKGQNRANRALYGKIYNIAKNIREKGVNIHLEWVPGHEGIYGNEKADQAAKHGADWVEPTPNAIGTSISFLNRKLREEVLSDWSRLWQSQRTNQGKDYKQFDMKPRLKVNQRKLKKQTWSTMVQLKLAHGYFRSYLSRLPEYDSKICPNCDSNQNETPHHVILDCPSQSDIRKRTIRKLDIQDQNLRNLFLTNRGQDQLIKFLEESKIATRKWLLRLHY